MKIAICDYFVDRSNAIGSFHSLLLQHLMREHEFTVLAVRLDRAACPDVHYVHVPVSPCRPLLALCLGYRLRAPFFIRRGRFDLVQSVEGNLGSGDLIYAHFCHRYFLHTQWRAAVSGQRNLRTWLRGLDHRLRAALEPRAYRLAKLIVVPSHGLQRELEATYPVTRGKICVIANPIQLDRMARPADFDVGAFRRRLGLAPGASVLVFIALGHFERKGLPLLLEALPLVDRNNQNRDLGLPTVLVVGGEPDLVRSYERRCARAGVAARVVFAGRQADVRPYIWGADAFILPSHYEVFPTVALEAAAAGIPLLSTPLNGVEEFLVDGVSGILMERTPEGIARGIQRFMDLGADQRAELGRHAREAVRPYSPEAFIARWRALYADLASGVPRTGPT
jgi:glycosyltransferase involved in cell wall biosynthesis